MYEYLPYDHKKKYPEISNFRAVVVEPKAGSKTVAIVSQSVNLDELGFDYLKRVRPHKCCKLLEVLIGPDDKLTPDLTDKLIQIPTSCPSCDKIISIEVPSEPPNTRDQVAIWSKIWPCSFKQPSILPLTHSELSLDKILPILDSLSSDSTVLYNPVTSHITLGLTQEHPLKHSIISAIDKFDVKDNYYCSKMWVITTQEPCIMCGMALVHSRIDRLYFRERHHRGAFTYYKLHLKKLNYMYRIVRVKESIDS